TGLPGRRAAHAADRRIRRAAAGAREKRRVVRGGGDRGRRHREGGRSHAAGGLRLPGQTTPPRETARGSATWSRAPTIGGAGSRGRGEAGPAIPDRTTGGPLAPDRPRARADPPPGILAGHGADR